LNRYQHSTTKQLSGNGGGGTNETTDRNQKKLSLLIFLSALAGMAVGGTLNVTAAELTEADCHDQAGHHSSGGTSR